MDSESAHGLVPLLVVQDAPRAIEFYVRALGAEELVRYLTPRGTVGHADLRIGQAVFSVTEEARTWNSDAPRSLGGSPVVLQLRTDSVDSLFASACAAGAAIVFPLQDFCGDRMGRLRDPFGHFWILSQRMEQLSEAEIRARRNAFFTEMVWVPEILAP